MPPKKISSVLARFEQTIQENNEAGGGGGMYLSNLAAQKKKAAVLASRTASGEASGPASRKMSVSAGSYRNFLQDPASGAGASKPSSSTIHHSSKRHDAETVSTAGMSDADWDPFATDGKSGRADIDAIEDYESDFSACSDASSFLGEDDEDAGERHHSSKKEARRRPKEHKRVGRLGNRKTRTGKSDPRTGGRNRSKQKEEDRNTASNNEEEEEEGSVVTAGRYIADTKRTSRSDPRSGGRTRRVKSGSKQKEEDHSESTTNNDEEDEGSIASDASRTKRSARRGDGEKRSSSRRTPTTTRSHRTTSHARREIRK